MRCSPNEPMGRVDGVQKRQEPPGLGDDVACSRCGAVALDTGLECDECGHDMAPELADASRQAQEAGNGR